MKIQLQNGCSHSLLSVNPKGWKTKKAKIIQDWFIVYRFYDFRYPKPKQVMIKGMNSFKTLPERKEETQRLIEKELEALKNGFNPFNKESNPVNEPLSFIAALNTAYDMLTISELTKRDIKAAIGKFKKPSFHWGGSKYLFLLFPENMYG